MQKTETRTFTALFPFCGLGAGALGFLESAARLGEHGARFVNLGGIDNDPLACRDFETLTGGPALEADLAALTPEQLVGFTGARRPDVVFLSPPCKGFSKLLSKDLAKTEKYEKLNRLVLQAMFLVCETWKASPPPAIIIENVPGIMTRGRLLLAQVKSLLSTYGYVFNEEIHDCGEVGGLGQHRRRYLLVARRPKDVPAYIYRPPRLRVRGCGEVLESLPMPDDPEAGALHELPQLSWLNWIRLALIPAGGDWRDLPASVPEAMLKDTGANAAGFKGRPGHMAVCAWDQPSRAVNGTATVSGSCGTTAVADPRPLPRELRNPVPEGKQRRSVWARWDVRGWDQPAHTVAGPGMNGGFGVADPRVGLEHEPRRGTFGVTAWDEPAAAVRGHASVRQANAAVADPRVRNALALPENAARHEAKYRVTPWTEPTGAVTGARAVTSGGPSVADPRIKCSPRAGTYGVIGWDQAAATITGNARIDNGSFAVADPRPSGGKAAGCPIIIAKDGTWHRPLTKLELAALQGLPARVNGKPLRLARMSDIGRKGAAPSNETERIGNAVPVGAARAIGESILTALLAASLGTWALGSTGIWVRRDGVDETEANAPWMVEDLERERRLAQEARFERPRLHVPVA